MFSILKKLLQKSKSLFIQKLELISEESIDFFSKRLIRLKISSHCSRCLIYFLNFKIQGFSCNGGGHITEVPGRCSAVRMVRTFPKIAGGLTLFIIASVIGTAIGVFIFIRVILPR